MNSNTGISKANDTGDWENNKEMNPAANSSVTEDTLLEDENTKDTAGSWRDAQDVDHGISAGVAAQKAPGTSNTGDPGRTSGKAEGVEHPEIRGNE